MAQASITDYFISRKRPAAGELKKCTKKLVLDYGVTEVKEAKSNIEHLTPETLLPKEHRTDKKVDIPVPSKTSQIQREDKYVQRKVSSVRVNRDVHKQKKSGRKLASTDIRETFQKLNAAKLTAQSHSSGEQTGCTSAEHDGKNVFSDETLQAKCNVSPPPSEIIRTVTFEKKGCLSPKKRDISKEPSKSEESRPPALSRQGREDAKPGTCSVDEEVVFKTPKKETKQASKQFLTAEQVKAKLSSCNNRSELRATLLRLNNCAGQLREMKEKYGQMQLQKFQAIELEVPLSPVKSSPQKAGILSPRKESVIGSPVKPPAYQRFHSLASPSKPSALILPYKYKYLAEVFRCLDTVVSMIHNRKEVVTFSKVKPGIQELMRRTFTDHLLGQVKRVFPAAYSFRQEKRRTFSSPRGEQYDLVIIPNMNYKCSEDPPGEKSDCQDIRITPSALLERKQMFENFLLELVKKHHSKFLQELDPPLVIPEEKLTRWHPEFELEQVPNIEPDILPQAPTADTVSSAKDVLLRAKNLFGCNRRMEKALEKASTKVAETGTPSGESSPSTSTASPLSSALKGIPQVILDKIRAKQAAKAMEAMTRSPGVDRVTERISRLPDFSRIVRNVFVAEQKSVLPVEVVVGKLENSYTARLSTAELEEHLKLLCKLLPSWISRHSVKKGEFLKLKKDVNINRIVEKLEKLVQEKCNR